MIAKASLPHEWGAENRTYGGNHARRGKRNPFITPYGIPFTDAFADDRYETIVFVTGTQSGKALALDTALVTPTGWTTINDIKIGDKVFDEQGKQCSVIIKSPIMQDKQCFQINFCDGSHIIASDDHKWQVEEFMKHRGANDRHTRIMTTSQIIARGVTRNNGASRYSILITKPLELPEANLSLPPYILGAWLGDGNSRCPAIIVGRKDVDHMVEQVKTAGLIPTVSKEKTAYRVHLSAKDKDGKRFVKQGSINISNVLSKLNLLKNKHIPLCYLRASREQRLSLLQGLMDTDGTADKSGTVSYCSKLEHLSRQVCELACSLGYRAKVRKKVSNVGYISWDVNFHAYKDKTPFRMVRKTDRLKDKSQKNVRPHENNRRYIQSIAQIDSVPVQCIGVDSPSHLFLAGDNMIPTHNTDGFLDVIGWRLDTKPRPQLYVGPSQDFVANQFEPRLNELFTQSPRLKHVLAGGKKNRKTIKIVGGVRVRLAWSGSATSLSSDQAGDVYIDELDKMYRTSNKGGDPYTLAKARADTFADRKIALASTPENGTVDVEHDELSGLDFWKVAPSDQLESPIWLHFQEGTRHHWTWQCPQCDGWFVPRFRDLKWAEGASPSKARRSTFLCCPVNGCTIEESHKEQMNAKGRMVAPGQWFDGDKLQGDEPLNTKYSIWVSGLASPFVTWGERVEEVLGARNTGLPNAEKAAFNKVGELWSTTAMNKVKFEDVQGLCVQGLRLGDVPPDVIRVTMGVDVQGNRLVYVVRGWCSRARSYLLDRNEIWGRTSENEVWDQLATYITSKTFDGLRIEKVMIDSGFRPDKKDAGDYHKVYDFARRFDWIVKATKGVSKQTIPLVVRKIDATAEASSRKYSIDLFSVDTDYFKSLVHSRLWTSQGQAGAFYLPEDVGEQYLKQLVSEFRSDGGEWVKAYRENHYFDCEVLAAVGGFILEVHNFPEGVRRNNASAHGRAVPVVLEKELADHEPEKLEDAAARWARLLNE